VRLRRSQFAGGHKETKIALVNQPFGKIILPWTGEGSSIDIWIYEVARRLARCCDVLVYASMDRHQKKVEYDQGVKYRRISTAFDKWYEYMSYAADKMERNLGLRNLRHALFYRNVKRPLFASSLYYLIYALQIAEDLRRERCDIVYIPNFSQYVPIIRAFNPETRIVLHMQCEWLTQLDPAIIEPRLRQADLILGCSEYITEKIRHAFPQFANRCQTAYNGVDTYYFSSANNGSHAKKDGAQRLLFAGRVSPEKGVHVLLNAFKKVVELYPEAQLEIVGSQWQLPYEFYVALSDDSKTSDLASFYKGSSSLSYFNHLQRQCLSLDIAKNVTFTGFSPHRQVVNNYRGADVLVCCSYNEAFCMPISEAMASELPVVATRVGGIPEIVIDRKTGLLVELGDDSELADAILRLISDDDLRKSLGKAARKRVVEHFSWEKTVDNLLLLYSSIGKDND
jgi:glycosyltransferase involved in cell wall biosynthesis